MLACGRVLCTTLNCGQLLSVWICLNSQNSGFHFITLINTKCSFNIASCYFIFFINFRLYPVDKTRVNEYGMSYEEKPAGSDSTQATSNDSTQPASGGSTQAGSSDTTKAASNDSTKREKPHKD